MEHPRPAKVTGGLRRMAGGVKGSSYEMSMSPPGANCLSILKAGAEGGKQSRKEGRVTQMIASHMHGSRVRDSC